MLRLLVSMVVVLIKRALHPNLVLLILLIIFWNLFLMLLLLGLRRSMASSRRRLLLIAAAGLLNPHMCLLHRLYVIIAVCHQIDFDGVQLL
mgnify:CR=1 FL=1